MNTKQLEVPRILYRGPDDHGAIPSPVPPVPLDQVLTTARETDRLQREDAERTAARTETCRVESHEQLEQKLKEGWRLHRRLDTDKDKDNAADAAKEKDEAESQAARARRR